jgi:ribosomal protein S18 acetylase RimI-like enzyme
VIISKHRYKRLKDWTKATGDVLQKIEDSWDQLCIKQKNGLSSGPSLDWFRDYKNLFKNEQDTIIYIETGSKIVGFLFGKSMKVPETEKTDNTFYIELFCGPGHGKQLWQAVDDHAKSQGLQTLALRAANTNKNFEKKLISYYQGQNFKRTTNACWKKHMRPEMSGYDRDVVENGHWMTKCLK